MKSRRAIVEKNLSRVRSQLDKKALTKLTKTVFRKSIANIFSAVKTSTLSTNKLKKLVSMENIQVVRDLEQDTGCVFLLFHMGNWEILARISKVFQLQKSSGALYQTLKNPYVDKHIRKNREKDGTQLFARKRGLMDATKLLKNGGLLGILCDQYSGRSGVTLKVFDEETSITPLPAILAQKYNVPIIPVVVTTTRPGKWKVSFQEPLLLTENNSKEDATSLLLPEMERIMREHCDEHFWFHDLWKLKRRKQR